LSGNAKMKVFHRFCDFCGKPQKPSEMLICASFSSVCGNLTIGSRVAKTTTTRSISIVFHRVVEKLTIFNLTLK
jgi:hypothetical protein